jgi:GNAT superfamily N-acetyltransferase
MTPGTTEEGFTDVTLVLARKTGNAAVNEGSDVARGDDNSASLNELLVRDRYPSELEADVVLRTGRTLRLRPIRPDDAMNLDAFHHHLSSDSIYRRYFSVHPELSHEEVCHLTRVDYVDRLALVIEDDGELVAVGRYERYPGTTDAEVAFIVRDDHQHLGLGHRLLESLADAAWARGITTFSAETLATNRAMMSVFQHSGYHVTSTMSSGEISLRFSIEPTQDTRVSRLEHRAGTL